MKTKHALPVIAGLLTVSAALIAGLASADMKSDRTKKSMMYAKKLDTNTDGAISLDELTARQSRRFAKIDQNSNGLIDKDEFNARLVAMFTRMDRNGDGLLRDDELPR
jgi:Ca2+-binding EF-hand superfamily protein